MEIPGQGGGAGMSGVYTVVIEKDEDGYFIGSVPTLPGCHTQARSIARLMDRMAEAIAVSLDARTDEPDALDLVGVQRPAM